MWEELVRIQKAGNLNQVRSKTNEGQQNCRPSGERLFADQFDSAFLPHHLFSILSPFSPAILSDTTSIESVFAETCAFRMT